MIGLEGGRQGGRFCNASEKPPSHEDNGTGEQRADTKSRVRYAEDGKSVKVGTKLQGRVTYVATMGPKMH